MPSFFSFFFWELMKTCSRGKNFTENTAATLILAEVRRLNRNDSGRARIASVENSS
jgi:hypothetical protein